MPIADPNSYAVLAAGTEVYFGATTVEDTAITSETDFTFLKDAIAVGAIGQTATFTDATRLVDRSKKEINAMPEAEDKEFTFLDDPDDTALQAFLAASEAQETVKLRIVLPNGRWNNVTLALGKWRVAETDDGPMKLVVPAKQNAIVRGTGATLIYADEA